jgi:signal transduction histidine kinase
MCNIEQVLINLVNNAVDAMDGRGRFPFQTVPLEPAHGGGAQTAVPVGWLQKRVFYAIQFLSIGAGTIRVKLYH